MHALKHVCEERSVLNNVVNNTTCINIPEQPNTTNTAGIKELRFLKEYRSLLSQNDMVRFSLCWKYSDIVISIDKENWHDAIPYLALMALKHAYSNLETYRHPEWFSSYKPIDAYPNAPLLLKRMSEAAHSADVGPMAAVAGAIADLLLETLSNAYTFSFCSIENGGDCAIVSTRATYVALASESARFQGFLTLELPPGHWGVATSSGTVGHSINFGQADTCTIVASSGALADAWATRCSNAIHDKSTLEQTAWLVDTTDQIDAFFGCIGEHMCYKGKFKLLSGVQRHE